MICLQLFNTPNHFVFGKSLNVFKNLFSSFNINENEYFIFRYTDFNL